MQMVIVSDPLLVHSIVGRSVELEKSTNVFYDQFNVVCRYDPSCMLINDPMLHVLRHGSRQYGMLQCVQGCCSMQLAHEGEKSNLFTSKTDDWWRLIRKGLSPAFSANNLRYCACA